MTHPKAPFRKPVFLLRASYIFLEDKRNEKHMKRFPRHTKLPRNATLRQMAPDAQSPVADGLTSLKGRKVVVCCE